MSKKVKFTVITAKKIIIEREKRDLPSFLKSVNSHDLIKGYINV